MLTYHRPTKWQRALRSGTDDPIPKSFLVASDASDEDFWIAQRYRLKPDAFEGNRACMFLTQPPVSSIRVQATRYDYNDFGGVRLIEERDGIRLPTLLDEVQQLDTDEDGGKEGDHFEFRIHDLHIWHDLNRNVDEVTGHEMLRLLSMREEDLVDEHDAV